MFHSLVLHVVKVFQCESESLACYQTPVTFWWHVSLGNCSYKTTKKILCFWSCQSSQFDQQVKYFFFCKAKNIYTLPTVKANQQVKYFFCKANILHFYQKWSQMQVTTMNNKNHRQKHKNAIKHFINWKQSVQRATKCSINKDLF